MKFAIATLLTLALAMTIECSVIGLGPHLGWGWGGPHGSVAVHASAVHAPWGGVHAAAPWAGVSHGWNGAWNGALNGAWNNGWDGAWDDGQWHGDGWNGAWGGHGHGAAIVVGAHGHGHEGSYVAKTRGAIHKAPLAGHIASAASINVAPAPGTV